MSLSYELVGGLAGSLTTLCWLPQAIKIIATRDTKALSLTSQAIFTSGCTLWAIYGVLVGSPSIVLFNVVTVALAGWITVMKIRLG